jgi:hypothetical protein
LSEHFSCTRLQLYENTGSFALESYATDHWADHAQFGDSDVLLSLHDNVKLFFNPSEFRLHFVAWVKTHNYLHEIISIVYPRLRNLLRYAAQLDFRNIFGFPLHCDLGITSVHSEFVSSQLAVTAAAIDTNIDAIHIRITKISTTHGQRKRTAEYDK